MKWLFHSFILIAGNALFFSPDACAAANEPNKSCFISGGLESCRAMCCELAEELGPDVLVCNSYICQGPLCIVPQFYEDYVRFTCEWVDWYIIYQ